MSPQDKEALAERMGRERSHDRIVRYLDKEGGSPLEKLARIDSDPGWWAIWSKALGFWAACPSDVTRHMVRETVRSWLPPIHLISEDTDER